MSVSTKSALINPTLFQHNSTARDKQTTLPTSKITQLQTDTHTHTQTNCSRPRITHLPLFFNPLNGGPAQASLDVYTHSKYYAFQEHYLRHDILYSANDGCPRGLTNRQTHTPREREREREREEEREKIDLRCP